MTPTHRSDPMTDKLREALAFYADFSNYTASAEVAVSKHRPQQVTLREGPVLLDGGERARAALAAAPQPAVADRECPECRGWGGDGGKSCPACKGNGKRTIPAPANVVRRDPVEAGARLAERFRPSLEILADGPAPETMAWAVVGGDGAIIPGSVWPEWEDALPHTYREGARGVRVAIRVVEGGDDA